MDTKDTARRSAKYYKIGIGTIPKPDKAQHQHTMEEEHSIKITADFRSHHQEIHFKNGRIHLKLIIFNKDQSADHQETGPSPQVGIFTPETAADRGNGMTASLKITTAARITGIAADFLEIPRTTVGNTTRIRLIQHLKIEIPHHFGHKTRRERTLRSRFTRDPDAHCRRAVLPHQSDE